MMNIGAQMISDLVLLCSFLQTVLQNLAHAEQLKVDGTMRNQLEYRQQLDELDREQTTIQVRFGS